MGLRVEFDDVVAKLSLAGKDVTKAGYGSLLQGAVELRDIAREYAPVDQGDLESAIIVDPAGDGKTVYIGIDQNAVDEHGTSVAKYGEMQHEGLFPYGSGHTGYVGNPDVMPPTKSTIKDAGRGIVGGKFIERAYNEHVKEIIKKAGFAVKRILRS